MREYRDGGATRGPHRPYELANFRYCAQAAEPCTNSAQPVGFPIATVRPPEVTFILATVAAMRHDVKIWPQYLDAIVDGRKTYEIRKNDRGYQVGDQLLLREWDPGSETYSSRTVLAEVTYTSSISQDQVVLAIKLIDH